MTLRINRKPIERWGRKASGLRAQATTAGLPGSQFGLVNDSAHFIGPLHATPLYRLPETGLTQSLPVGSQNARFKALRGSGPLVRACSGSVTRQLQPGWDLHFLRFIDSRPHSGAVLAAAECVYGQRDSLLECPEREYQWIRLDQSRRIQDSLWHGADTAYEHDRAHKSRSTDLRFDRAADRNNVLFRRYCRHKYRSGERPVAHGLHCDLLSTNHTDSLANVSRLTIFIMPFLGEAPVKLARLPAHDPSGRFRAATAVPRKSEPQGSAD